MIKTANIFLAVSSNNDKIWHFCSSIKTFLKSRPWYKKNLNFSKYRSIVQVALRYQKGSHPYFPMTKPTRSVFRESKKCTFPSNTYTSPRDQGLPPVRWCRVGPGHWSGNVDPSSLSCKDPATWGKERGKCPRPLAGSRLAPSLFSKESHLKESDVSVFQWSLRYNGF